MWIGGRPTPAWTHMWLACGWPSWRSGRKRCSGDRVNVCVSGGDWRKDHKTHAALGSQRPGTRQLPRSNFRHSEKQETTVLLYNLKAYLPFTSNTAIKHLLFNKHSLELVRAKSSLPYHFLRHSACVSGLRKASTTNMLLIEIS